MTPWVHVFVDVPAALVEPTQRFWSSVTVWPVSQPWPEHPEFVTLSPPAGTPYAHVQRIDGPPRIHLDLVCDDLDIERDRLSGLGAVPVARHEHWQVMSSPSGLPFCLCREDGPVQVPEDAAWPDGHHSRLVQLCLDVPSGTHDTELAFWRAATGWPTRPGGRPEFHLLVSPPSVAVQLLVQRLGDDDPDRSARAHIDLGTDDVAAEVGRLRDIGAVEIGPVGGWVVMRDPADLPFCVTRQRRR